MLKHLLKEKQVEALTNKQCVRCDKIGEWETDYPRKLFDFLCPSCEKVVSTPLSKRTKRIEVDIQDDENIDYVIVCGNFKQIRIVKRGNKISIGREYLEMHGEDVSGEYDELYSGKIN